MNPLTSLVGYDGSDDESDHEDAVYKSLTQASGKKRKRAKKVHFAASEFLEDIFLFHWQHPVDNSVKLEDAPELRPEENAFLMDYDHIPADQDFFPKEEMLTQGDGENWLLKHFDIFFLKNTNQV
mmetsp:Transcript_7904/g.10517  ORF Transcript_7904/g.10517 Transcript_7904/m.10517 type:complete len:125 (-) Transcript_7904:188-562(-)|eukprot:CAMPEP_0117768098 /NCGR_PEP_ID=MMETSP0947-20121206/22132_1 /TAXON_ID=44440 /ORGANISM="Chattonella subsalsa, Strain CCMP2191" /LENGTH=124 /DNA_ID=CAMNT_0005592133 /DNA_START=192 /DNA_END=566 /DNA_ORIENTATION=+